MDERLYLADPELRSLATSVIETGEEAGRPFARLEQTVFYPEGGGQPADRGRLGDALVVDVQSRGDRVYHYVDRPVAAGPVRLELDWDRRFDHMQQHTGQHLLTAVCDDRHGWATLAFHLGESYSAIDLDAPSLNAAELTEVEDEANAVIREARPVRSRRVDRGELAGLKVRTRGLPDEPGSEVRLVEIENLDLNTCGGTHVRTTAELQVCHLIGTEKVRQQLRLKFAFGGRAIGLLRAAAAREAALKKLLGASPEAFVEVAAGWDRDRRGLSKALRSAEAELAAALAAGLAAAPEELVVRHLPERDPAFLRTLASRVLKAAPAKTLVLFGDDGEAAFFLVAAGTKTRRDVQDLGGRVQAALDGKGGGKGTSYQGRGPDRSRIPAAMETVDPGSCPRADPGDLDE